MKSVKYFLKQNKFELITGIFAILGYVASYFFVQKPELSFFFSILITFVATTVIVYLKTREKDFYFLSLQKPEDKEDWMGEGIFQYDRIHNSYTITESYSGFIFSKCLNWSDYVLDFEFKILNKSIGVILRATNLSNLVMLQLVDDGIRAHIRINGFWQVWEHAETKLTFSNKLNLDKWYRGRFQCNKGSIRIRIYSSDKNLVFDRVWSIPSGQISFSYKSPKDKNIGIIAESAISSIPFPINLEYGTAGFRNYDKEKALVKNVLIEKIQGIESVD